MDKFTIKKSDGYTIMSNHHLRDQNISHAARGLLSFMLSLPRNWDYSFNGLVSISKEGKTKVKTMLEELKQAKYIKISQSRNEKGHFQYNYEVYEFPFDTPLKTQIKPIPDYRYTDKPLTENQPQINTNKQNDKKDIIDKTKNIKHEALINELIKTGYIKKNDIQISLYDSLFDRFTNDGKTYIEIYSALHYILPKVISRNFMDEEGKTITNKFGYLKTSIESNFKKFEDFNKELYSKEDYNSFFNHKNKDREER